jgi:hypothetical protein
MRSALSIRFKCGSIPRSSTSHPNHLGRAVAPIRDQARRGDVKLFGRAVDHRLRGRDLCLAHRRRRLDIHDYRMLQIDEVIVGVGISGDGVGRSGVAGRRIGRRDRLRLDRRRPAEGRVIEERQILCDGPTGRRIKSSTLPTPRLRCASATMMLTSTAKASPPTIPSFTQRAATVSNSLRRRSPSRKRP